MENLFIIVEQFWNGYNIDILTLISFISILTGIFVLVVKNPIISVLFLICLFLSIACYLILLGISYIGLSYLLVYIGAVSILFLFILMLIDIRISELQSESSNSIGLSAILGGCFFFIIYDVIPQNILYINNIYINKIQNFLTNNIIINNLNTKEEIFFVSSGSWDNFLIENLHITSIGNIMYNSHFILLIISSLILLLSMVGSIIITLRS